MYLAVSMPGDTSLWIYQSVCGCQSALKWAVRAVGKLEYKNGSVQADKKLSGYSSTR